MQRSFMHRVRSFVASSLRAVGDALAWCFSPVPGSVKNWLTVLFLGVVLLDIGLAYIYVVPSLQNRLVNQKLTDLAGKSQLVATNFASVALDRASTSQNAATLIDTQINARIVVIDLTDGAVLADSRQGLPLQHRQLSGGRRRQAHRPGHDRPGHDQRHRLRDRRRAGGEQPGTAFAASSWCRRRSPTCSARCDPSSTRSCWPAAWRSSPPCSPAIWPRTSSPGASNASSAAPCRSPRATSRARYDPGRPTRSASSP